ncbi:hypothetical protein AGMMS49992_20630 [Clostridia bacterium]|nr:hypothetical protein AGMMS49992_20630 [Clostridia bacterium]
MNAASSNVLTFPSPQSVRPAPKKRKSSATRRKDGRYQKSLSYTLPDGKHMRKCFYGKTQAAAIEKRETFRREVLSGVNMDLHEITYKDYVMRWLSIRKAAIKSPTESAMNSLRDYEHYASLAFPTIGNKRIRDVLPSDLVLVINMLSGMSFSYSQKVSFVYNNIFRSAYNDRILTFNTMQGVKVPRGERNTHRSLDPDGHA